MSKIKDMKKVGTGLYQYRNKNGVQYRAFVKLSFQGHSWNEERRGFSTKTQAGRWIKDRRAEVQLGLNLPKRADDRTEVKNSLGYYTQIYLDSKRKLKTHKTIVKYLQEALDFFGPKTPVPDIDKLACIRYANHLDNLSDRSVSGKGDLLAESTKLRFMCYLKAVLEFACDDLDIKTPKTPIYSNKRMNEGQATPSDDDFRHVLNNLTVDRHRACLYLILLTGMRRADVMSTRWSDFSRVSGKPVLKFRSSKNQVTSLSAVVPANLMEILMRLPKINDLVFFNERTHERFKTFHAAFHNACSGLENLYSYHSFRKLATRLAVEAVGDINIVAMYMGWSNPKLVRDVYCPRDVAAVAISDHTASHWEKALAA